MAAAVTQVKCPRAKLIDLGQSQKVCLGNIHDVDVIANARAIRRFVIGAEDLDVRSLTEGDFEHVGNEVRFDPMIFAETFFRRADGANDFCAEILFAADPVVCAKIGSAPNPKIPIARQIVAFFTLVLPFAASAHSSGRSSPPECSVLGLSG